MEIVKKIKRMIRKKKVTFEEIADEWLEIKEMEIKRTTYSNYVYIMRKYLFPTYKNLTLKELEKYDYKNFTNNLSKNLSPKTTRDILCVLKSILHFIKRRYGAKIDLEKIKGPRLDNKPVVILNDEEIKKMEKYCLKQNNLKSIGVIMALNTGLRIGEVCGLKWKRIDLDKKEIYIKRVLERVYVDKNLSKTKLIMEEPKTKSSVRKIPISNKLYEILKPLKNKYENEDFFLTGKNKGIEPNSYEDVFKDYLKEIKLKQTYTFHILRHTFATKCLEKGMDIKSLSEILGHSNVEMTLNRYVHSSFKIKKKYLDRL